MKYVSSDLDISQDSFHVELLAEFDRMNEEGVKKGYFIGSTDVLALYPSLDI